MATVQIIFHFDATNLPKVMYIQSLHFISYRQTATKPRPSERYHSLRGIKITCLLE